MRQFTLAKRLPLPCVHHSQHGWLCRPPARRLQTANNCQKSSSSNRWPQMAQQLQQLPAEEIKDFARADSSATSMAFICWLAALSQSSPDNTDLQRILEQLVALQAGLGQLTAQAAAGPPANGSLDPAAPIGAPSQEMLLPWEAQPAPLTPAAVHREQMQIAQLDQGVRQARSMSALSLMGRRSLSPAEGDLFQAQAMQPSAAERILEWLLTEFKSPQERAAQLPDAFEAPAHDGLETDDDDADALYTTPIQLIQALDSVIAHLDGEQRPSSGSSQAAHGWAVPEMLPALSKLRRDVYRWLRTTQPWR